jgi:hypothetical protein
MVTGNTAQLFEAPPSEAGAHDRRLRRDQWIQNLQHEQKLNYYSIQHQCSGTGSGSLFEISFSLFSSDSRSSSVSSHNL